MSVEPLQTESARHNRWHSHREEVLKKHGLWDEYGDDGESDEQ